MRVSTPKSRAIVRLRKWSEGELLPQENEFQYPRDSDMKVEPEMDRRIGAVSAALRAVHQTIMVKKERSRKAKQSI